MTIRFALLLSLATLFDTVPAHAARKAAGCAEGRFAVTQGSGMLGDTAVIALHAGAVSVEGGCPTTGKLGRTSRKGTRVSARWDRCGEHERIRLRATARDCSAVRGTVRARDARKTAFVAMASTCGDGIADPGAGEQCDGAQGCGAGEVCAPSCECERAGEALDCVVEGYPCSWGEVPPDVAAHSIELADAASAILTGGGTLADAQQAIQTGNPVVLETDAGTIRFRLAGGRPVWVEGGAATPSGTAVQAPQPATAAVVRSAAARLVPRSVVDAGRLPKAALILAPVAWLPNLAENAPLVASLLSGIEDYTGNVISLANASVGSTAVDVSTFAQLEGFNVVYVNSQAGRICYVPGPNGRRCRLTLKAVGLAKDGSWKRFDDTTPGIDYMSDHGEWFIGVSADFFRHHYPHGLSNALVVFDAAQTANSDLARSLSGSRTNVVGWDADVSGTATPTVVMPFLTGLAAGRSTSDVYLSMGQDIRDAETAADLVIGQDDIRIRDLVRAVDPFSLQPLASERPVTINGYTDDDVPDRLVLLLDFWGADAENAAAYTVSVFVDGTKYVETPLDQLATPSGDYRWHGQADLDLGFDVHERQPLDIKVTLGLPEGGASVFEATPPATGPGFSPGRKWTGHFTKTFSTGMTQIDLAVDATFERDPAQDPASKYPKFLLTGGTMRWTLTDLEGDSCVSAADPVFTDLAPDDGSWLKFDLAAQPPEYSGFARTEGPLAELTRTCPNFESVTTTTQAGGVWFQAPGDQHYIASGSTLASYYESASQLPSVHEWSLQKVE